MTAILLMGVSGSGKTTVGTLLASALGTRFVDADSLHSEANRQKMAAGIPLNDADRAPWLAAVGVVLAAGNVVVACSALRRRYRDGLRLAAPDLRLVYLRGNRALLIQHLAARRHEFMPPELLDSQLGTLEPPAQDEDAIIADIDRSPPDMVAFVVNQLQTTGPTAEAMREGSP
jgi:gluconokinase